MTQEHPRAHGGSAHGRQISASRVRDLIAASIRDGYLDRSAPLPEHELMETFNASRGAVRSALADLQNSGLVVRRRGLGTFAVRPVLNIPLSDVYPLDMEDHPGSGESRLANPLNDSLLVPAFPLVQDRLGIDDEIIRMVEGVWTFDGEPIGLRTAYFPWRQASDLAGVTGKFTMRTLIATYFHTSMGKVAVTFGADTCDARTARLLRAQVGAPLVTRDMTYFDRDGGAIQTVFDRYRADRVQFTERGTTLAEAESTPPQDLPHQPPL